MNSQWNNLAYSCLLPFLIMVISCNNNEPVNQADDVVELSLSTEMVKTEVNISRSPISGSIFPTGSYEFGTWVCFHEDDPEEFVPSQIDFNHIRTLLTVNNSNNNLEFLYRDRPRSTLNVKRKTPIDIYSYHPYLVGPQYYDLKPDSVPFTVSTNETDWMWAKESIGADNLTGGTFHSELKFSHAMTCIRLILNAKYDGSTVSSITLTDTQGRIYKAGWLDLASQTVVLDENSKTNSLLLGFNRGIGKDTSFYFILPEIPEFRESELKVSFVINNVPISETFIIPPVSYTTKEGTEIKGFVRGFCYTYRVEVDNTLTFSPVEIDEEWNSQEYTYRI